MEALAHQPCGGRLARARTVASRPGSRPKLAVVCSSSNQGRPLGKANAAKPAVAWATSAVAQDRRSAEGEVCGGQCPANAGGPRVGGRREAS